jgi:hypothetical protein
LSGGWSGRGDRRGFPTWQTSFGMTGGFVLGGEENRVGKIGEYNRGHNDVANWSSAGAI